MRQFTLVYGEEETIKTESNLSRSPRNYNQWPLTWQSAFDV